MSVDKELSQFATQPITRQILLHLLKDYARPNDKISHLVEQRKLISLRNGLFVAGSGLSDTQPEPFLVANHLFGPSYISFESALAYWELIPEKVFDISSASMKRSRVFTTPIGTFTYDHLPLPWFSFGQTTKELAKNQYALIASPEKALCDKIIITSGLQFRNKRQLTSWLFEDMRLEEAQVRQLNGKMIGLWLEKAPKKSSLELLVTLIAELW